MTTNAEIAKIINRAAELVEEGWHQGSLARTENGKKHRCMFCAIVDAADGDQRTYGEVADAVSGYIRRHHGSENNTVIYNDTPGRTQQEVVDTLRAAAREVETEA